MALAYPLKGQPSYMQQTGMEVVMISADGKELQMLLANEPCRHIVVPMTRKITPLQDLKCILQLIKIFKKEKPAIIHTETPKAGLLGMIAAKIAGIKVRIHTVAGLPLMVEKGAKMALLKTIEKLTYAAATNVWPNSDSLKKYIIEHNFTASQKINIIGNGSSNGIDTVRYNADNLKDDFLTEIKKSVSYSEANTYLLFIGRLVLDKGIVELVNVFSLLQKDFPYLRLILTGQYEPDLDPLPAAIEDQIKNNTAIIHINWTDKVEYYMHIAHYFVFPSYREGFPNVLLEAAAMKLPILCSRITGNVDIVTDNETGLIFTSMNEKDLKAKLIMALNDSLHMKQMAETLFHTITTVYNRELFWKSMREAYQDLLNK